MKLFVLKGFSSTELEKSSFPAFLLDSSFADKQDLLKYDDTKYQSLIRLITSMQNDTSLLYEEFIFLCLKDGGITLSTLLTTFNIELKIIYNNIYPEIYPCYFQDKNLLQDAVNNYEDNAREPSNELKKIYDFYNKIYFIDGEYYVSYKNLEYDIPNVERINFYSCDRKMLNESLKTEFVYEIGEDLQEYIEKINELKNNKYKNIGIKLMGESQRVKDLYNSFCAFLNTDNEFILTDYDEFGYREDLTSDFKNIVSNVLKVPDFKEFRDLDFYETPSLTNNLIKINQTQIMSDMVEQAKKAMECEKLAIESDGKKMKGYRDIFVTAPTGAGKSLMFQIPAIYLANNYGSLTIIITPLIELMNDQVRNLHERGYQAAERLNSSINPIEKKNIVKKISDGEINLLYLAPETLLSYSIDQLIGERKIGLVIIDEAHIVSTWGKGFRPDYWYLGSYLDKLRKMRNSRGMKDKSKSIYCFPICTFTATAVYGGKYDDVNDIKNSLNLRDTITYFGKVIRDNISFNIVNHMDQPTANRDEYEIIKNHKFAERIGELIKNDTKAIVYFPYAKTAYNAYIANGNKGFSELKPYTDHFSIYTGSDTLSADDKSENMMDFRDNRKKIMFATKAFGMGIDIKDIQSVYHYAASGNLNDYVQEIGRVARSKDIPVGIASSDYYDRDLNFMKTLYGMSALHNYQVQKILSIIINVFDSKRKYNLLVTPDMFKPVFSNCSPDQLENKIKSALLTIEKDLDIRYNGSKPIVTRARNMFTECFAMVDKEIENSLMNSKYGKYFKKIANGKNREVDLRYNDPTLKVTEMGDIFLINLKELWEEQHSRKTFGEFKYELNTDTTNIFEQYAEHIKLRNQVIVKTTDGSALSTLKEKLLEEINLVSNVLNELQIEGGFYSKDDIAERLEMIYKNRFKAKTVANSYLDLLDEYRNAFTQSFIEMRNINDDMKYRIKSGIFRSLAETAVNTSPLLKKTRYSESDEYISYDPLYNKAHTRDNRYDAINLALLFGLVSFEIIGGNKPEIFIRINYPEKIRQIVDGKVNYTNSLIEQAKDRHENDVAILSHFFTNLESDDERWNFIEKYYLGKIMTDENGKILMDEF